ncbi:putative uncharacterized protein DDB_G0289263 [Physella acuta]|uniref:putative uncharacterized protein DDB_G0289263 n=1 Tax=Physella acuta TaxID=109671 RepID=UPI0027DE2FB7|nr:putative uncharacterized protein DDB_G0289263 [Physella acuta]XP_059140147.1 putative uncharacterized protein DDB_G0289263 [Physella acuta]
MPVAIAMASSKLTPRQPQPTILFSTHASTTTTSATTSVPTISIPVSAIHDPYSNVITITPCLVFKTTATVAEQMQALRQDKKLAKPLDQPTGALRVKRRTDLSKLGLPEAKPASVSRRNARERNRVKQVNLGFETLREHVPNGKKNKKMSKVQTLRSAAQYIKDLYTILHGELPALGSPNMIEDHEPDSPLDNSVCSMSDTDNDVSVSSPDTKVLQAQHLLQQSGSPPSPHSPVTSPQTPPQPRQKVLPLILKKENISVLQQQLSRPQASQPIRSLAVLRPSPLVQDKQAPRDKQTSPLAQEQQNFLMQHEQLRLALRPVQQPQQSLQPQLQQQQQQHFDPAAIRMDHLTCSTVNTSDTKLSFLSSNLNTSTLTQLSPVSLNEEHYEMDLSPDHNITDTDMNTSNGNMDLPPSPSALHPSVNDVNMNVIDNDPADFNLLQKYYNSIHNEQFRNIDSSLIFDPRPPHSVYSVPEGLVHSPAASLSSTSSTISSETDVVGSCDYESVDTALLDISNWISELCSQSTQ